MTNFGQFLNIFVLIFGFWLIQLNWILFWIFSDWIWTSFGLFFTNFWYLSQIYNQFMKNFGRFSNIFVLILGYSTNFRPISSEFLVFSTDLQPIYDQFSGFQPTLSQFWTKIWIFWLIFHQSLVFFSQIYNQFLGNLPIFDQILNFFWEFDQFLGNLIGCVKKKNWIDYRFDEFEFLAFVHFLKAEDVFETGLAEVALLHFQNGIGLKKKNRIRLKLKSIPLNWIRTERINQFNYLLENGVLFFRG